MSSKTRAKGNRNQRRCIEKLQSEGWLVDKVEKTGKFIKQKDLFGLFDIVALKGKYTTFIQITSNRPHTHKKYLEFGRMYGNDQRLIEQWVHYDHKGWVVFWYDPDGRVKIDERRKK